MKKISKTYFSCIGVFLIPFLGFSVEPEDSNISNEELRVVSYSPLNKNLKAQETLRKKIEENPEAFDLKNRIIKGVNFSDECLESIDFSGWTFYEVKFKRTNLINTRFTGAKFYNVKKLGGALLCEDFKFNGNFSNCDLVLEYSDLIGKYEKEKANALNNILGALQLNLKNEYLSGLNLKGINLANSNLSGANLQNTNLKNAVLTNANLRYTDLSGANLSGADLSGTNLTTTILLRANIQNAILPNEVSNEIIAQSFLSRNAPIIEEGEVSDQRRENLIRRRGTRINPIQVHSMFDDSLLSIISSGHNIIEDPLDALSASMSQRQVRNESLLDSWTEGKRECCLLSLLVVMFVGTNIYESIK